MVARRRSRRLPSLVLVVAVLAALLATAAPAPATPLPAAAAPAEQSAILFAADGMRPDLVDRFAASGAMPNLRELKRRGVQGRNGLTQGFPPNTGVGWYTLATGAWPGKHGSTNNTFHQTGTDFSRATSFSSTGVLQADSIASAAERAGRQVAQLDWVAGRQASIAGPTVDFTTFFSTRGVLAAPANPDAGGTLDIAGRTVRQAGGGTVELSEREAALLALLAARPGVVFSRAELLDRVFDDAESETVVDTYVHYCRRKLGRGVISTVRGLGYRLGST